VRYSKCVQLVTRAPEPRALAFGAAKGEAVSLEDGQVAHIARLARLALSDDERRVMAEELSGILAYAERVSEVAAAEVEPTAHPYPLANVVRPDEVGGTLPAEEALANAPVAEAGRFRVPAIVSEA